MSTSASATSAPAVAPATLAQLKKIVLQAADLPAGWKGTAYQADPSDAANNAAFVQCVGGRNTDGDKVAEAHSDDFSLDNATVSSSATSYKAKSDVDTDVAILTGPKVSPCFEQMIKKQLTASLPAGGSIKSVSLTITPGSAGGPSNVVATGAGTVKVEVSGQEVPVYLNVAFITGPLIEAEIDAENVGSPVSPSVMNPLVSAVATRANG